MRTHHVLISVAALLTLSGCGGDDGPTIEEGDDGGSAAAISVAEEDWVGPDEEGTDRVASFFGDEHCDLETVEIVAVDRELLTDDEDGPPQRYFAHDPEEGLSDSVAEGEYRDAIELPDDAEELGFTTTSGIELWADPDEPDAILLVDGEHVEQWPAARVECD